MANENRDGMKRRTVAVVSVVATLFFVLLVPIVPVRAGYTSCLKVNIHLPNCGNPTTNAYFSTSAYFTDIGLAYFVDQTPSVVFLPF
jgi:hypothetical protein